jgi:hypothetical protein
LLAEVVADLGIMEVMAVVALVVIDLLFLANLLAAGGLLNLHFH